MGETGPTPLISENVQENEGYLGSNPLKSSTMTSSAKIARSICRPRCTCHWLINPDKTGLVLWIILMVFGDVSNCTFIPAKKILSIVQLLLNKTDNVECCHLVAFNFFEKHIERNLATSTLLIRIVAFIIPEQLKSKVVGNNTTYYTANIYTGMGNLAALRVRPGHYDRTGARPSTVAPTL